MREFDHSLTIAASSTRILEAFFDPRDLASWWHVSRSLCVPRMLGSYAVEWKPTEWKDDLLGRFGGVFRGTVIDFKPGREFLVADSYWLPPDGDPVGPMAFTAACTTLGERALLHVRQSGGDNNQRWTRYYELLASDLRVALDDLKGYLEARRPTQEDPSA